MARKINRLNARAVATITKHGRHADGGGGGRQKALRSANALTG